jgi:hypothetical protein
MLVSLKILARIGQHKLAHRHSTQGQHTIGDPLQFFALL